MAPKLDLDHKSAIYSPNLEDGLSSSALPSGIKDIKQEYELWNCSHKSMKESPPPEGRDYLKHAKKLLNLLEVVAELHPIAKGGQWSLWGCCLIISLVATVFSFKAILLFEEDRRENDARVAAVFLAQTDMMRVLLESVCFLIDFFINLISPVSIDHLANRLPVRADLEDLRINVSIGDTLEQIQKEIKICGNSIDTYYKERRLCERPTYI